MKVVSILSIFLYIISACRAQCGSADNQTNPLFSDIEDAIDLISNCVFSANKFNAACVSVSCPELTTPGLCPYTSTRSLNLTALTTILSILNSCFRAQPTICSAPLTNIPVPPMEFVLSQVFVDLPFGGQCSKIPNLGSFNNVQNTSFAISPKQSPSSGPLNVVIDVPLIKMTGGMHCTISVGSFDFSLPNINYTWPVTMSPTASIDFSDDQPDVNVQVENLTTGLQVGNFARIGGLSPLLPAAVQSLFTDGMTAVYTISGGPTAITTFYATFIAFGIEATKGNCGPSP